MKGVITALGIISFAATMAVAKTKKFHAPTATASIQLSYAQWLRPYSVAIAVFPG